jgi:predicted ATPase/DNA-binding CsgD family transcriptional regulator
MLSALSAAWTRGGELVLLSGEAGAGKTRLAVEFAARSEGAAVLGGACDADLALPYQPWVTVAGQVLAAAPELDDDPRLAPLGALLDRLPTAPQAHPTLARARLYDAFAEVLAECAARWPTLVVLDDLHWAGPQTLALLAHLVRVGLPAHTLLLGTFRDTGDELGEPLARCLAELRRHEAVTRLTLVGLDAAAVERYVADAVGHQLDADLRDLAHELAARSGGNAFYLGELWRHLVGSGAVAAETGRWTVRDRSAAVPDGVREVVTARLRRLTPEARRTVEMAAVAGAQADLTVVAAALGVVPESLDLPLAELLDARLLTSVAADGLVYRFAHALVREAVEAMMRPIARRRAHLAMAEALERAPVAAARVRTAELARHLTAAAPLSPPDKTVHYARLAAADAAHSAGCAETAEEPQVGGLSRREREVLDHMATGLSNRQIGARLFISEHTVAHHVRAILRKTGTANRTEAAGLARR